MPPRGGREDSTMSAMVLDATQRSHRREQDVSDGPGCHPEETEKRAGCQRWPWMPPRLAREESRMSVMALEATQRSQRSSRMSVMALDATQRSQRREQDVSDGPGCHPEESEKEQDVSDGPGCHQEESEKRAGCQQWPGCHPEGDREESRMSAKTLDATQRSQRREQDVNDDPGCHPEESEKRAGCQRWPWMPPRGAREEIRKSAMALNATQRSQRREQNVSDGPGCHQEESEKRAGCQR